MRRAIVSVCIVVGLGALISAEPPKPPLSVSQKLAQRVQYSGLDDPRATLNDALNMLAKRYKLSFDINAAAFKSEGFPGIGRTVIADPKPIPAMKNVRLDKVLKTILARVPVPSGATLRVRGDKVEITTNAFLKKLKKKKK
ncbi:MAG: hypothetical protein ACRELF_03150 [Gemmataceae bacterium]